MGIAIKLTAKIYTITAWLAVFIGLPLLFYALGDAPRRSLLKESISLLTLLGFSMMVGQFFLARSNEALLHLFKPSFIRKVHQYISYTAVGVILIHPFLVVLPRYFEAGVKPWDAFVIMLTTFDSLGIIFGLVAWLLLLVLIVFAFFRKTLIRRFRERYCGWRNVHGKLAILFTVVALWHSIDLGRHTDAAMSIFFVIMALFGFVLLAKLYWGVLPKKSLTEPFAKGAST